MQEEFDKLVLKNEKEIKKAYRKTLREFKAEISVLFENFSENDRLTLENMRRYGRLEKFEKFSSDKLTELYKENKTITETALKGTFKATADGIQMAVGPAISVTVNAILKKLDIDAVINAEMQGLHWADRLKRHRSEVIYNVNKTVREGLYNGETYTSMAKRLTTALEGDVIQPLRIVRTETGRVQSQTQKDILDPISDRVEMTKTWISSRDERVRSSHKNLNNIEILYRDNFTSPLGSTGFGPRLLEGPNSAADSVNCRCWLDINFKERA